MLDRPKTYGELFDFYDKYVKLLYSTVQASNHLPLEVLFEINAAFDHLSRAWIYKELEPDVVAKAYSHLKRSCLDVYKLRVKEILDQYDTIQKIDTSIIDNGEFDQKIRQLIREIKIGTTEARKLEGRSGTEDDEVPAFGAWQPVFEKCLDFETNYYFHPKLEWAKKKNIRVTIKQLVIGIITTAIAGALSYAFLEEPLGNLFKWLIASVSAASGLPHGS